jgi:hypothetical protein
MEYFDEDNAAEVAKLHGEVGKLLSGIQQLEPIVIHDRGLWPTLFPAETLEDINTILAASRRERSLASMVAMAAHKQMAIQSVLMKEIMQAVNMVIASREDDDPFDLNLPRFDLN